MDLEKKHIIYTAEDIQQYFSGKMAPAEMHAIEKAALDDTFLAEAMEGYGGVQEQDWSAHLISLKQTFANNQVSKVIVMDTPQRFGMWKIAAAILVICSSVAITYTVTNKELSYNKTIAKIGKTETPTTTGVSSQAVDSIGKSIAASPSTNPTAATEKNSLVSVDQQPGSTDSSFIYRPETAAKMDVKQEAGGGYVPDPIKDRVNNAAGNNAPVATQNNNLELFEKTGNKPASQEFAADQELKKTLAATARKFNAQVLAPDGTPLPFANIRIPDENIGTYADAKGNFRLVSPDTLLQIEIKSAGYISRQYTLKSEGAANKIMLSEDETALKEKTRVVGVASVNQAKRRAALVPDSVISVEPADGWNNYDTYITNNLSIPEDIRQKKIHGEVEVSFEVQSNGAITNMKIDKSLCGDCDEAALRVIKEGPRWKVKNGNKATARVRVKF